MRIHLRRPQIVDGNDLHFRAQLGSLVQGAQYVAADPSVSVNCNVDHRVSSPVCEIRDGECGHTICPAVITRADTDIMLLYYKNDYENAIKRTLFMFYYITSG